jgi:hypothetical protein
VSGLPSSVSAKGGAFPFSVTTGSACAWSTQSDVSWADVNPASGQGSATPSLRVAESTQFDGRTLTMTINGQAFRITQQAVECSYALSDTNLDARNEGGRLSVRVASGAACRWSVTTNASWITVRTPSGIGTDYVYFDVAPNSGGARQGVVTIAGQPVTVTQAAG